MTLTVQDITRLAPDAAAASAGAALGAVRQWQSLGHDAAGALIWGLLQGSGTKPYMTVAETSGAGSKCSCPSRKFPCKHALGLWLAFAAEPAAFAEAQPPAWAEAWAAGRAKRAAKPDEAPAATPSSEVDAATPAPAPDAKAAKSASRAAARREALVGQGVELLVQWLADLARQGLAGLPGQARDGGLEAMVRRMVDCQAPGLAQRLERLRGQLLAREATATDGLAEVGRLYALCEAWSRRESLPAALRADIQVLLGFTPDLDALREGGGEAGGTMVGDRWTVLAAETAPHGKILAETVWLWGERHRGFARVDQFFPKGQRPAEAWERGQVFEAEMAFLPSTVPQRAVTRTRRRIEAGDDPAATGLGADALLQRLPAEGPPSPDAVAEVERYRQALARLPWLDTCPLWLKGVRLGQRPGPATTGWALMDAAGRLGLPLDPAAVAAVYPLLAVGQGQALDVVGLWDGTAFTPWLARGPAGAARWEWLA